MNEDDETLDTVTFKNITVTLIKQEKFGSLLTLSNLSVERQVNASTMKASYVDHWHFTGWPDDGIPKIDDELNGCNKLIQELTTYLVNNYENYR